MTDSHGLHFKTFLLILMIVVFALLGNVLLGKGMKPSALPRIGRWLICGPFSSAYAPPGTSGWALHR